MKDVDESTWRNRFILVQLSRIVPTILVLVGLVIWHTGWLRPGGMPALGFPLTLLSLAASFTLPRYLARKWRTPVE